jgi:hypothetical protein
LEFLLLGLQKYSYVTQQETETTVRCLFPFVPFLYPTSFLSTVKFAAFVSCTVSSAVGCITKQLRTKPSVLNYSISYRRRMKDLR